MTDQGGRTRRGGIACTTSHWHLLVTRVSFLMFVRDYLGGSRSRVQSAKTSITGDDIRHAFLNCAVLAVPVHVSLQGYY